MTLEGLLASLAWSGVTAFGVWRLDVSVRENRKQVSEAAEHWRVLDRADRERAHDAAVEADTERLSWKREQLDASMQLERLRMLLKRSRIDAKAAAKIAKEVEASGEKIELPDDLEALALQESELWAQDDMRSVIREKYHEHKRDWQAVRRAVGIGELP